MAVLASKSKEKRPKFLLNFAINELINIPQSSGVCYVKWSLKDGTGVSSHRMSGLDFDAGVSHVSLQSKGETPKLKIDRHRITWDYKLKNPIVVKLHVNKHGDLMRKDLRFKVHYETNDSDHRNDLSHAAGLHGSPVHANPLNHHHVGNGKLELGSLTLNLADLVKVDETPISNRFLLKDSKVNSLLGVSLQMQLVRGSYSEFNVNNSSQLDTASIIPSTIPELSEEVKENISPVSSHIKLTSSIVATPTSSSFTNKQQLSSTPNITDLMMSHLPVSTERAVENLYQRTFQVPWDPRLNEYNIKDCVNDIIHGGNGWAKNDEGVSLIDLQSLKLTEMEYRYYNAENDFMKTKGSEDDDANNKMKQVTDEYMNNGLVTNISGLNKKEYLEKKLSWQQRTEGLADKSMTNDEHGRFITNNVSVTDIVRDAKSWAVNEKLQ